MTWVCENCKSVNESCKSVNDYFKQGRECDNCGCE